jgi:S-adenosylmethionine:tRNA ribosyltransferase-isomerase
MLSPVLQADRSGQSPSSTREPPEWPTFDFRLPRELEAGQPPEARGLQRDQVRLMVSLLAEGRITHTRFDRIGDFLHPGDVLVINTSGTRNAALEAARADGAALELRLSTHLPGDLWVVELRRQTEPYFEGRPGEALRLPGGGQAQLLIPYRPDQRTPGGDGRIRLWIASLQVPGDQEGYFKRYGFPIRYKYVRQGWPLSYYQTVYATQPGSAEMPSAGRAFTPELITRLAARGVRIAPLLLHTGVASLEAGEPPYEERYQVPRESAQLVNLARDKGKRVIAVGTTAVRALETVAGQDGQVHPGQGWTDLVISPSRGLRAVEGLLTGLHEPRSSHLAMLAALTGLEHLKGAYSEALREGYLWHEFGDLHLILP